MILIPKKTGTFKSFDGTRIYYEVRGEGKPLILCYGIGCLMNHWIHQTRHFANHYQVILFDYRAHHRSEIPLDRERLNLDAMAQDIRCLMDHLEISSASVWGHSFGAQLLARAYDMYPQSFDNLIFINGFVKNPLQGMFGNDAAQSFFHFFKSSFAKMPETFSFLWRSAINNPLAIQMSALAGGFNLELTSLKDIEIYSRGVASLDLDAFIRMFESMMNYDGTPVLERIAVPTLIIGGRKDSVTPQKHQEDVHKKINGSQFLMVPYGSHCTQLDMPELVNLKIQSFLDENQY